MKKWSEILHVYAIYAVHLNSKFQFFKFEFSCNNFEELIIRQPLFDTDFPLLLCNTFQESHYFKKAILKNLAIFNGKHLCWSLFLIRWQAFLSATVLKRDFQISVFSVIKKFLKPPILQNSCERLLLNIHRSASLNLIHYNMPFSVKVRLSSVNRCSLLKRTNSSKQTSQA